MIDGVCEDYDEFVETLKNGRLGHWVPIIENSGCRILISFTGERDSNLDVKYEEWCFDYCVDRWMVYSEYYVLFNNETDAMAFKLEWT